MEERLLEGNLLKTGWFSETGIRTLISWHYEGQGNYARPLLNLLVLERWINRWKLIHSFSENFMI
jgi:hypothetical protein